MRNPSDLVTTHRARRQLRGAGSATMLAIVLVAAAAAPAVAQDGGDDDVVAARAGGADRFETAAIAMTEVAFPTGTNTAVVVTGADFSDALSAAALTGAISAAPFADGRDAALLLTRPDELPEVTADALEELGVEQVYVLGGEAAVSAEVVATLAADYDVARIGGANRYETAANVARSTATVQDLNRGPLGNIAFIATGETYADAVAAGAPAAAGDPIPILLTTQSGLPQATIDVLDDLDIGSVFVLGGEAAVSDTVTDQLFDLGIESGRIAGATRQETAAEIARRFTLAVGFDPPSTLAGDVVTIARGDDFADALVGGVTAAAVRGPLLLTRDATDLGDATREYLSSPNETIDAVRAMGGTAAVSADSLGRAVDLAAAGSAVRQAPQSWILAPQEALTRSPDDVADFTLSPTPEPGNELPDDSLVVALYDCDDVDATGQDRAFGDADDDGIADGHASSETGAAAIAVLNGVDIDDTSEVPNVEPLEDGTVTFRLYSGAEDCAVPVVFSDRNRNERLDLDRDDRPEEPYNVGQVTWTD